MYSQCEPTNLISDASFEIDAMYFGMYESVCESTSEYSCVWERNDGGEITNSNAYDGNYSWKTNSGSVIQMPPIGLSPNTNYILSCWVNTLESQEEYVINIGSASNTWIGPTDGWEKISLSFTTGIDNLTRTLGFACYTGEAYFDLFELCAFSTLVVEDETPQSKVSIYPNPSKGIVNIDLNKLGRNKNVSIKVFNAIGQLVFQNKHIKQDDYRFYLNDAPGLYFIEINSNNRKQYFKLIKE